MAGWLWHWHTVVKLITLHEQCVVFMKSILEVCIACSLWGRHGEILMESMDDAIWIEREGGWYRRVRRGRGLAYELDLECVPATGLVYHVSWDWVSLLTHPQREMIWTLWQPPLHLVFWRKCPGVFWCFTLQPVGGVPSPSLCYWRKKLHKTDLGVSEGWRSHGSQRVVLRTQDGELKSAL